MHTRVKREIIDLARSNTQEEICGFIYADLAGNPHIRPCANLGQDKTQEFEIDPLEYLKTEALGQILGVYHSHPTPAAFSDADLECAEELAIPFYLYDIQQDKWSEYLPASHDPLIECSPFVLGFSDCYELVRRYFRHHFHVYLSDYDRDETFCHEQQGIIIANFDKEGFFEVPVSSIQAHDVILFRTDRALPQHFGVFLGKQSFLHHPRGALSRREMLTDRWLSRIFCVLRRKK